ncbi:MAG: TraR/DksA family transcriptional regulator [Actinomycetota bacterium]
MNEAQLSVIRRRLEEDRASVRLQLQEYESPEGGQHVGTSLAEGFSDAAAATTERSEAVGHLEQLQTHRDEVEAALTRLDDGTYGRCERCGEEIPLERLEALPTATLCVACKQAAG